MKSSETIFRFFSIKPPSQVHERIFLLEKQRELEQTEFSGWAPTTSRMNGQNII